MSATNVITAVKVSPKFKIDASQLNWEDIVAIRKICSDAAKALPDTAKPKVELDLAKETRKALAVDAMDILLGMNKVFTLLKSWRVETGIQVPNKALYTFESLGINNVQRFNYLMTKLPNVLPCFSKSLVKLTPRQFLERVAKVCDMDEAKFATLQRSRPQ